MAIRFNEIVGTNGNDSWLGSNENFYFGLAGDDYFRAGYGSEKQVFIGGSGNDTYVVDQQSVVTIFENGDSLNDKLVASDIGLYRPNTYFITLDSLHLFIFDVDSRQQIYVYDWANTSNGIEIIIAAGVSYTFDEFSTILNNSNKNLGNYSFENFNSTFVPTTAWTTSEYREVIIYLMNKDYQYEAEVLITQEKNEIRDSFDADYYIAKYSVFDGVYGNNNDFESVLDHYVRWGKAVGRTYSKINETEVLITQEKDEIRDSFDADYYIAKYSVFDGVYGNNNDFEAVLGHYVRWGKAVGRSFVNEYELSLRDSFTGFSTENSNSLYGSKSSNSKIIDGGSGIDTITYSALSDSVSFTVENSDSLYGGKSSSNSENNQDSFVISQTITETIYGGKYGTTPTTSSSVQSETLTNIERLHFTDKGYGLDIDGNTGVAAKIIIAAFGTENLPSKMSSILTIVDNGITINEISNYVIQRGLIENVIGSSTNGSFVDHVYENVVGTAPSSADHDVYTALLDNGTYTKSSLLALAANTSWIDNLLTDSVVDLIGVPGNSDGELLAIQYDIGLG